MQREGGGGAIGAVKCVFLRLKLSASIRQVIEICKGTQWVRRGGEIYSNVLLK